MRKVIRWVAGSIIGGVTGALVVTLLSPATRRQINRRLKTGYHEALEAARQASQQRRAKLEAEFNQMSGIETSPPPPDGD